MRVKHLSEQATAEFKERRRHWGRYVTFSLDTLDLIERTGKLTDAERIVLKEYLLHRKRERKAKLELIEKRADYLERAALPVAVTAFSVVTWLLIELQASPYGASGRTSADVPCLCGGLGLHSGYSVLSGDRRAQIPGQARKSGLRSMERSAASWTQSH